MNTPAPAAILDSLTQSLDRVELGVTSGAPCHMPATPSGDLSKLVEGLLETNRQIWELEDRARMPSLPATDLAAVKRAIDPRNQLRNDYMNAIDHVIYDAFRAAVNREALPYNSESIGSIIDRITILSLKAHHLDLGLKNDPSDRRRRELVSACVFMRGRLRDCLVRILKDALEGRATLVDFRQIKLYNDPHLNPFLREDPKAK